jgi:CubicO group peptidase (beta-lactamase class C family)
MAPFLDFLKSLTSGTGPPQPNGYRADAQRSATMDDHIRGQIGDRDPGLALAIIKSSAVVHAAGYGLADIEAGTPVLPETIFHMASCGKQLTAVAILMLAEAGRLGLDDPIGRHLPEVAGFGPKVTLRHLLHHTSGIRDLYDEYGTEQVLARCAQPSNADVIGTFADLKCPMATFGAAPGDAYAYSNSGYELLGSVIERVSGQSYRDFFQTMVFDPLGMKDTFTYPDRRLESPRIATGYILGDDNDYVACGGHAFDSLVGSGSFYTTIGDLCRYDGALATNALINSASMREALTSGRTNDGQPTDYGFGWYIGNYEGMRYADHDGEWNGYFSYICRYLDQSLSIFVLSNNPNAELVEVANLATEVYR